MARSVSTFLMFEGAAEEAMRLYVSLFPGSEVREVVRFGAGEGEAKEGSIKRGAFTIGGHQLICFDSPGKHAFTFTPSISLFVECADRAELDGALAELSKDGHFLMPPDNYGFSTWFAWLVDRWGVSWQLNLP